MKEKIVVATTGFNHSFAVLKNSETLFKCSYSRTKDDGLYRAVKIDDDIHIEYRQSKYEDWKFQENLGPAEGLELVDEW